jgi:hypothetical protein
MLAIDMICVATVIGSLWVRVRTAEAPTAAGRATAVGASAAFVLGLAIWLPGGPLAAGWARRAGTPVRLISSLHTTTTTTTTTGDGR